MEKSSPSHPAFEKVLVVDDVPENVRLISATLEPEGYEILVAASGAGALRVAAKAQPGLILLDVMMPELDGLETCRRLKEHEATRDIPVIFVTARHEIESLARGFQVGGVDYLVKPFQTEEILSRVASHLRLGRLTRELQEKNRILEERTAELLAEIDRRQKVETALRHADDKLAVFSDLEASRGSLAGLIGSSLPMRKLLHEIERLHDFPNTSVLILGESGTGKELVARAIHFDSARAKAPFIPINCVAIPSDLAESILFGHVRGAFTGAVTDRKGCFEMAEGGTLFLDEIGDMPAAMQAKLLRVLEDGCVTPIGASTARKVDVRVIAATNADLHARVAGSFRQDLFFRLARYTLRTPPLRERIADLRQLSDHFLRGFAADIGRLPPRISPDALEALEGYDFPGNIRELKNIIERALIESGGEAIELEHIQLPSASRSVPEDARIAEGRAGEADLPLNVAEAEEALIKRALEKTGGNIAEAARLLGVNRTRIYRKLAQEKQPG